MRTSLCAAALLAVLCAGCNGPTVDVSQALQIVDMMSGWSDGGIAAGQNKLPPAVAFQLKNTSDQTLPVLQVNAYFRQVSGDGQFGDRFLPVIGSEGLAPGATTKRLVLAPQHGYTGTEARLDILKNSHFVDAKVEVLAKYGSTQWKRLGEFPIARQLVDW
jgi:hypothetical protein